MLCNGLFFVSFVSYINPGTVILNLFTALAQGISFRYARHKKDVRMAVEATTTWTCRMNSGIFEFLSGTIRCTDSFHMMMFMLKILKNVQNPSVPKHYQETVNGPDTGKICCNIQYICHPHAFAWLPELLVLFI